MTDYAELRAIAQAAKDAPYDAPDTDVSPDAWEEVAAFRETFDPDQCIALLDRIAELEANYAQVSGFTLSACVALAKEGERLQVELTGAREFISGHFILPTGRCVECGLIKYHDQGCEVDAALNSGGKE